MTRVSSIILAAGIFCASMNASAAVITLDFDSLAGGSNIVSDGFVSTSEGNITLFQGASGAACIGCFGSFPSDLNTGQALVEADNSGANSFIGLDFSFNVVSLQFNFGGDGGGFEYFAYDSSNNVLDSLSFASNTWVTPGFHSISGVGSISSIRWRDPVGGAALDNIILSTSTSAVPEPAPLALLALGLAGIGFSRKKKIN